MHFFKAILAGAFAATALAQANIAFTSAPRNIQAGTTVDLKWSGGDATAPVTITLRAGDRDNLQTVSTLTTTATGGSYEWSVPRSIGSSSTYAFQISQTTSSGTQTNYWGPIAIAGGTGTLVLSSSSAPSSSASVSRSASTTSESSTTSGSSSVTSSGSSTTTSGSSTSSGSSSTTSTSSSASAPSAAAPSDTGAASNLKSNAALMVGAAAAIAYIA